MIQSKGYAAQSSKEKLAPYQFQRRELLENDVLIEIQYCGVCHSDIHQVRNEWAGSKYPIVPGHEIIGVVRKIGAKVNNFSVGDRVGVGCMVDSCQSCASCRDHLEQYCEKGSISTYNSIDYHGEVTLGGYSNNIVVRQEFVLSIPDNLDAAKAAPLLCAGITTYSPIQHLKMTRGHRVGVVGLGGLGHMAVKIACAKGCEVTVFTTSESKREDAKRLGAKEAVYSKSEAEMKKKEGYFHFIIDTVAAPHNLANYTKCLQRDGKMVLVGLPDHPHPPLEVQDLIFKRKSIVGSLIGGIQETQEMLEFCSKHQIESDIELIPIQEVNEAFERAILGDVKYRFVIDISSLEKD